MLGLFSRTPQRQTQQLKLQMRMNCAGVFTLSSYNYLGLRWTSSGIFLKWETVKRINTLRIKLSECGARSCSGVSVICVQLNQTLLSFLLTNVHSCSWGDKVNFKMHMQDFRGVFLVSHYCCNVRQETTAGEIAQGWWTTKEEDSKKKRSVCLRVYLVGVHRSLSGRSCQLQPWHFSFQP